MRPTVAESVAAHPLFAGLSAEEAAKVAACARNEVYGPGRLLLAEGDDADTLYLIDTGTVSIEIHAPHRGPIPVETVGPGGTVGWSWLFPPFRWQFDARAVDTVGVVAIDGSCLRAMADADDAFGHQLVVRVAAVLLERLQATRIRLLDLYGADDAR
jgi:CRP/FNR family transcriptional regulator, cyclic AMP receptor protein